jgi:hypothetical protein
MTRALKRDQERNATWIAVLTQKHDVPAELAHQLRVAAYAGRLTHREAMRVIDLLQKLPPAENF